MLRNAIFLYVSRKKLLKDPNFLGGTSPADFSTAGDASPVPRFRRPCPCPCPSLSPYLFLSLSVPCPLPCPHLRALCHALPLPCCPAVRGAGPAGWARGLSTEWRPLLPSAGPAGARRPGGAAGGGGRPSGDPAGRRPAPCPPQHLGCPETAPLLAHTGSAQPSSAQPSPAQPSAAQRRAATMSLRSLHRHHSG